MILHWDSWSNLIENKELGTLIIELITLLALIFIIGSLLFIKKNYPKFTKKGFGWLIFAFIVFGFHLLCDLLDTWAIKKIDDANTVLYTSLDLLDAIFSFSGLFLVGFAFYRIANYGMELWRGEGD